MITTKIVVIETLESLTCILSKIWKSRAQGQRVLSLMKRTMKMEREHWVNGNGKMINSLSNPVPWDSGTAVDLR